MKKGSKMKLTLLFVLFVTIYVILNAEMTLQQRSFPQRNSRTFLRFQRQQRLASLLRVPQIICSYAQYGRWPEFDTRLRPLVLQFSKIVFAMSDESIRLYCTQVSRLNQFYRPQGRPREFTLPPIVGARATVTPRNYFTIRSTPFTPFLFQTTPSFRAFTIPPFTTQTPPFATPSTTTTQRPFFAAQTFATIAPTFAPLPVLPVVTIPTTTRSVILPVVTVSSATTSTTTTVAPSYSGSSASGSGSASYSSASASASATGTGASTSSALKVAPGTSAVRKFRASNGDIVVHLPYQRQSLRKIPF